MFTALLILQVVMGLSIIGLVLLQQGKGADMGAAFGAGSSGTVFGARGGGSFFTRATAIIATAFFINSVLLSSPLVLERHDADASVTQSVPAEPETDLPELDVPAEPASDVPDLPDDQQALESAIESVLAPVEGEADTTDTAPDIAVDPQPEDATSDLPQ